MFTTDILPMPDNSARAGQKTGLWKVVYWDQGEGSILQEGPKLVWTQNLTWDEALEAQILCKKTLNG